MKKLLALLLALIMCVAVFAACASETKEPGKAEEPGKSDEPGKTDEPGKPEEPAYEDPFDPAKPKYPIDASKAEAYIVVANDKWAVVSSTDLAENDAPKGWYEKKPDYALKDLNGYKAGIMTNLAPEGCIAAVKVENIDAYGKGDLDDEDIIFIEEPDTMGYFVGKELLIQANGTDFIGAQYSGKSVVGALTITKNGDKYTVKINDKTYFDGIAATEKFTERAYDANPLNSWYVSKYTMKAVLAYASAHNMDLQYVFGNDERDVTTIGLFYDEFYNFNYEGGVDGYDWDGDGKIDLVMVNRPVTGKVYEDSDSKTLMVAVAGDNKGYCGTNSYRTNTTLTLEGNEFPAGLRKNEMIVIYEDYRTDKHTVVRATVVRGVLNSLDIDGGKAIVNGKEYNLDNSGELPYINGLVLTQFDKGDKRAHWEASVQKGITIYVDSLDNVIAAVLPNITE